MSATILSPIATRFAWKEYRALRSFWLAALVIAALLQVLNIALAPPHADRPTSVFAIALAAAALYAVGVAATTFSMEHEEETYAYLTGLPTRWLPLFAGKLSFAFASSLALALALVICGWFLSGWNLPSREVTLSTLGVFGVAIVEMIAWGTLFSLTVRQPLLAALLAIAAESVALTWAVNISSEGNLPVFDLNAYGHALPARLAIFICICAVDVLLARRWLTLDAPCSTTNLASATQPAFFVEVLKPLGRFASWPFTMLARQFSARVFGHLCWQTWRQSWRLMLALPAIVVVICFTFYAFANGRNVFFDESQLPPLPFVAGLFASALYASVVFCSDQHGQRYRFLAEHAAWPRYVWLARLTIWLLPIVTPLAIVALLSATGAYDLQRDLLRQFRWLVRENYWGNARYMTQPLQDIEAFSRGMIFGLSGILTGLALGQACSLFFRRALVAGFAALVIAVPMCVWGLAIWAWELSTTVFLLPLAIGLFAATWLRAPDWIVDRNSSRAWLKVAAAILIPALFIAWQLPAARKLPLGDDQLGLAQVAKGLGTQISFKGHSVPLDASAVITKWLARDKSKVTVADRATGDRLVRLAEMIELPPRPIRTDASTGPTPAQQSAYRRSRIEMNRAVLDETASLSSKPAVFTQLFDDLDPKTGSPTYDRLTSLADMLSDAGVAATEQGKLDDALKYHLAALQLWARITDHAPTYILPFGWTYKLYRSRLVDWAGAKNQTTERLRQAIASLDAIYPPIVDAAAIQEEYADGNSLLADWAPPEPLVTDYLALRDILLGKQPSSLVTRTASIAIYIPVIANQLPFERARALDLLDYLFVLRTAQWYSVVAHINQDRLQRVAHATIVKQGDEVPSEVGNTIRYRVQLAYESSFNRDYVNGADNYPPYSWLRTTLLLRAELERQGSFGRWMESVVNAQVASWGLRQQLALVAYRIDHGNYPETLDALIPDYLPFVPIDPYSGRQFEYQPEGLPLELRGLRNESNIPANTPFLWSVGAPNAKLELHTVTAIANPNPESSDHTSEVYLDIYELMRYARGPWDYTAESLVFPLPKPPAKSPKLAPP